MAGPYSQDLRERAVAAVEGGLSRRRVAGMFKLGVATPLGDFVNPFCDGLAVATRPCASEDDSNPYHEYLPCCFRYYTLSLP